MIVDTHIHLDDARYDNDFEDVIKRAYENGVERFVIPGADRQTLLKAINIAENHANIYFSVGIHPYDLEGFNEDDFKKYLTHPKCVAVGECGMDYYRLDGTPEENEKEKRLQEEIFRKQIRLAKEYNKPLIVHIRDASHDAKMILLDEKAGSVGGVLHCYNADEELLSLSKENFYFGIGGVVTFKNAKKLLHVLPKIPLEKLVVETDGPYLTPTPHRGERNEPAYTRFVVERIAELLQMQTKDIEEITTRNSLKLFDIS